VPGFFVCFPFNFEPLVKLLVRERKVIYFLS
jgi:hypothetical protein